MHAPCPSSARDERRRIGCGTCCRSARPRVELNGDALRLGSLDEAPLGIRLGPRLLECAFAEVRWRGARAIDVAREGRPQCCVDAYVIEEARRNLVAKAPDRTVTLDRLLPRMTTAGVQRSDAAARGDRCRCRPKDRPVWPRRSVAVAPPWSPAIGAFRGAVWRTINRRDNSLAALGRRMLLVCAGLLLRGSRRGLRLGNHESSRGVVGRSRRFAFARRPSGLAVHAASFITTIVTSSSAGVPPANFSSSSSTLATTCLGLCGAIDRDRLAEALEAEHLARSVLRLGDAVGVENDDVAGDAVSP